jgi:putative membrane protein
MAADNAPLHAKFNPLIKPFPVMKIGAAMMCTVVGIPLAIAWFLGVDRWWAQDYFDRLECHLGERHIRFRKGILVTTEKTIPLERPREALRHPAQAGNNDAQLLVLRSIESKLGEIADLLHTGQ